MKNHFLFFISLLTFPPILVVAQSISTPRANSSLARLQPAPPSVAANYGKLPLSFEANQGQTDSQVKFLSRGNGYSLFLTNAAAVLELSKSSAKFLGPRGSKTGPMTTDILRMEVAGASREARAIGVEPLPGSSNYFIGKDPAKWRSNVPSFARVQYAGVYPGVDLVYYGNQKQLEYDFVVAPGADPKPVKLHFSGVEKLRLNADGDLTIIASHGQIAFHKPVVYQQDLDGHRQPITGNFKLLAKNTVGFSLGYYDHTRALVIDPVLAYSTYLGGTFGDTASAIAVDNQGNAYVSGQSLSLNFPTNTRAYQRVGNSGGRPFISKLDPSGSVLIYSTFLGGSGVVVPGNPNPLEDFIAAIAVDGQGNAYVTGNAVSSDFPTTRGAFLTVNNGGDNFVTKLNSNGSALVYSTMLGGAGASGIAVDGSGNAFVAGSTSSFNIAVTSGALQMVNKTPASVQNGPQYSTGTVVKLNATGSAFLYATYLGGSLTDYPLALSLDSAGNVYVVGNATSGDFPTSPGAYQTTMTQSTDNYNNTIYVAKLNAAGSALVYSTFLGPNNEYEGPSGIDTDSTGAVYVTGHSQNFNYTSGAFQQQGDNFVAKLDPTGSTLVYATALGDGYLTALAADANGNVFVTGDLSTYDFPVTADAFQSVNNALQYGQSAFLSELSPDGSSLLYSTYFGGSSVNICDYCAVEGTTGVALALDRLGNPYVAGYAFSPDMPVTSGAYQTVNRALTQTPSIAHGENAFVAKFAFNGATATTLSADANPQTAGVPVTFTVSVQSGSAGTTPQGNIRLLIDGALGPLVPLQNGVATYTTGTLPTGTHSITADYLGSPSTSASSAVVSQTITGGQTAAPVFSLLGGTYQYQPLIALSSATSNASIHYTTNGTTPNQNSATYSVPIRVAVNETVNAIAYSSGSSQSAVVSQTYTIVPAAIATRVLLTSDNKFVSLGQTLKLTAAVQAASGPTPTGSVSFLDGNQVIGTSPLVNGGATLFYSSLSLNGHDLTAIYLGSATNSVSGSPVLREIVNP